jgi:hypothetical protein
MTNYIDETPCQYFIGIYNASLLSIDWLDYNQSFVTGILDINLFRKLEKFKNQTINILKLPTNAGLHTCNLCQFDGPRGGNNYIIIPGNDVLYICPELITHYISCHRYMPPKKFIDSLLNCPDINTMDYKNKILNNGGRNIYQL